MSKIKAVLFDNDGVILNSNYAYLDILEKLFKKYGIKTKKEEVLHHFGEKPKRIIQEEFHKHNVSKVYSEYTKMVRSKDFLKRVKIISGSKNALEILSKKYKLALITGAIRVSAYPSIRKFGLHKYFETTITSDDVKEGKPNPESIRKAMKKLGVRPSECLYVGDAPSDVKMAERARVKVVVVLTGVLNRGEARKLKADYIIKDLSGLGKILKKIK